MATYDIPLDLQNPKGAIDAELAHIVAHFANDGITVTNFQIIDNQTLRLRITAPGPPTNKTLTHFKVDGVEPEGNGAGAK